MKIRYAIPALALLALPAAASAHHAAVTCDQATGTFIVTPSNTDLHPWATFTDTTVTVVWDDHYHVTLPLPLPCEPPVVVPPPVVVVPPPVVPPPPAPPIIPPPVVGPPPVRPPVVHDCAWLRRVGAGPRAYAALGHYPGCRVPKKLTHKPSRRHPAVTG